MWLYSPSSHCVPVEPRSTPASPELYLGRKFARSCTLSGKLWPFRTWLHRWKRGGWMKRRSGALSTSFQIMAGESFAISLRNLLSDSRLVSLASPGRTQGGRADRTTSDGFGQQSTGGFARFDRASSSWKTCQLLLVGDLDLSREPWPARGIVLRGTCIELPKRALPSDASGSSWSRFYPTPSATSYGSSQNEGQVPHDRPSRGTPSLDTWARLSGQAESWPTPMASDSKGAGLFGDGTPNLSKTAAEWPTPKATEGSKGGGSYGSGGEDLTTATRRWPTPMASDGTKGPGEYARGNQDLPAVAVSKPWPAPTACDAKGSRRSTARTDSWTSNPGTTLTDAALTHGQPSTRQAPTTKKGGAESSTTSASGFSPQSLTPLALNPLFVFWLMGWGSLVAPIFFDLQETGWFRPKPAWPTSNSSD